MKNPFTKLDAKTFSSTPASKILMRELILEENRNFAHTITKVLAKSIQYLDAVMDIKDDKYRKATLLMWRKHFIDNIDTLSVPDKLKTYTKNTTITYWRMCLTKTRKKDLKERNEQRYSKN